MTRYVAQQAWTRGQVDAQYRDRTDAEFYGSAVAELLNWVPESGGGVVRRGATVNVGGGTFLGGSNFQSCLRCFEFQNRRAILNTFIGKRGFPPADLANAFLLDTAELDPPTGLYNTSAAVTGGPGADFNGFAIPSTTLPRPLSEYFTVAQVGPSVFIASEFFPPQRFFFRNDGTLGFETVQFREELLGTVAATNASTSWTGTDTVYDLQLQVGDIIFFDNVEYEIATVPSATSFTTTVAYAGITKEGRVEKAVPFAFVPGLLSGRIAATRGSNVFTGTSTLFTSELSPGDRVYLGPRTVTVDTITNDLQFIAEEEWDYEIDGADMRGRLVASDPFRGNFPRVVAASKGRVFFGGYLDRPTGIRATKPGAPFTLFGPGVEDDKPIDVELLDSGLDAISWMIGVDRLYIGSRSGEYAVGEPDQPITPTNFAVRRIGTTGGARLQPASDGARLYFVAADRMHVFATQFDFGQQAFATTALSLLVPELTGRKIRDIAFQPETGNDRSSRLLVHLDDLSVALCTLSPSLGVVAWSEVEVGTPNGVLAIGAAPTYIGALTSEVATPSFALYIEFASTDSLCLDVAKRLTTTANGILTVPPEYEDSTVTAHSSVLGSLGGFAITSALTLNLAAFLNSPSGGVAELGDVTIGYGFTSRMRMLPGNYADGQGSKLGRKRRLVRVMLGLLKTTQLIVGTLPVLPQTNFAEFTGRREVRFLGWGNDDELVIEGADIYPAQITSVVREYSA